MENTHTSELVLELEELSLDDQGGFNTVTRVLESRRGKQESSESEGEGTRDTNQAVTLVIENGGQAWSALPPFPLSSSVCFPSGAGLGKMIGRG